MTRQAKVRYEVKTVSAAKMRRLAKQGWQVVAVNRDSVLGISMSTRYTMQRELPPKKRLWGN